MNESEIKIGADGIDAEEIVRKIRERAEARRNSGVFDMDAVVRAERFNLSVVKDNADFFDRYIASLGVVFNVDINDFEIIEHRSRLAPLLKRFKKGIWSILKFYTYRLWSQQNQVNKLFHSALELMAKRDSEQLKAMQARIDDLEARLAALEGGRADASA